MSFRKNDCQQLSFVDSFWGLTEREKKVLQNSWAGNNTKGRTTWSNLIGKYMIYQSKAHYPRLTTVCSMSRLYFEPVNHI